MELDPRWEYWTPDPEVAAAMAGRRAGVLDRLTDGEPRAAYRLGLRFGRLARGGPDWDRSWVARERPGRAEHPPAPLVVCPCCKKLDRLAGKRRCRDCRRDGRRPPRPCRWCRADFAPGRRRWRRFCSRRCLRAFRAARCPSAVGRSALPAAIPCPTCHTGFHPRQGWTVYCSKACAAAARKVAREYACKHCGGRFVPKRPDRAFCSKACSAAHHHAARRAAGAG